MRATEGRRPEGRAQDSTARTARQPGRCNAIGLFKKCGICTDLHSPCVDLHTGKIDHRTRGWLTDQREAYPSTLLG
jgi:hypothetical protein